MESLFQSVQLRKSLKTMGQSVLREHQTQTQIPTSMGVEQLIVEMDGSMIPRSGDGIDQSPRQKNCSAKNSHSIGREKLAYVWLVRKVHLNQPKEVTLGSVDQAVKQLADIAIRAGLGSDTWIHGVGDGATRDCQSS